LYKYNMATQSSLSKYQKLTDKEHILKKPDTYIGSIENTDHDDYIFNDDKIIQKQFQYIPGLYKLFDEGIVIVVIMLLDKIKL